MHANVRTVGSVTSPDGVEIRYETAGSGGPPLLFVHGWSCDRSYWRFQIDYFAGSHLVVELDLGGHGESGLGRKDWTIAAFANDVCAVIGGLELKNVVLVGHSMGGPVIVETSRILPERVRGLIPVDFFQDVERRWSEPELSAYLASFRSNFQKRTEELVRGYFRPNADPRLVDWVAHDMAAAPPTVAISALENTRRYDSPRGLATVTAPLTFINSDFWATDLQAARRYASEVQLLVLQGVGHFLMLEAPDEFNELLAETVSKLAIRQL